MSIKVELRNSNRIITLNVEGKAPILSRSGSPHFHNSMELLCVSYGSCVCKEIWNYCHFNGINLEIFQSFNILMNENQITLIIQHSKDLNLETKKDIIRMNENCPISKLLVNTPTVEFIENEINIKDRKDQSGRSCCGD